MILTEKILKVVVLHQFQSTHWHCPPSQDGIVDIQVAAYVLIYVKFVKNGILIIKGFMIQLVFLMIG